MYPIKNIFVLCLICFSIFIESDSYAHISPIPLAKGKLIFQQEFKKTFSFEYIFDTPKDVLIQDIGIDFFNVGDDDTSSIFLKIYTKSNHELIYETDTLIKEIYNQSIYIDVNKFLSPNTLYQFVIGSKNSNNDDLIHLFSYSTLPFNCEDFPLRTMAVYEGQDSFLSVISTSFPYLTFGIGSQIGIDFISEQKISKYASDKKATIFSTRIKNISNEINVTKIGLNYLDVGIDSISNLRFFVNDQFGNNLFSCDSIFKSIFRKKVDVNCSFSLKKDSIYEIGLQNLNKNDSNNVIFMYKPDSLPYVDNLNMMQILGFKKNNIDDSLGVTFYLNYKIRTLEVNKIINQPYSIFYDDEHLYVKFENNIPNDFVNIITTDGKILSRNPILNKKICIEKTFFNKNSLYIIENENLNILIKYFNL